MAGAIRLNIECATGVGKNAVVYATLAWKEADMGFALLGPMLITFFAPLIFLFVVAFLGTSAYRDLSDWVDDLKYRRWAKKNPREAEILEHARQTSAELEAERQAEAEALAKESRRMKEERAQALHDALCGKCDVQVYVDDLLRRQEESGWTDEEEQQQAS